MEEEGSAWASWLGIAAVLFGVLLAAAHATEVTRQTVIAAATPADGELPPAECPEDELEEEGLSPAECRQLVSNVRNLTVSAPPWFPRVQTGLAAAGLLAALASAVAGAALLDRRPWAPRLGVVTFGVLAAIDAGGFAAASNAGPILRDLYLWPLVIWFFLHLAMTVAAVAVSGPAAPREAGA